MGVLLTAFLFFSFGITAHADTGETNVKEKQDEISFKNAKLIKSKTDEKTGVTIDVYGSFQPTQSISTFAGNGSWDALGGEIWVMNGNANDVQVDGIYKSTGGDYAFVLPTHEMDKFYGGKAPYIHVELWDRDPYSPDDYIGGMDIPGPTYYPNIYLAFRNIDKWVDGNIAEVYTTHFSNYTVLNQALFVQYFD